MKKLSFNEIRSHARVALRGNYATLIISGLLAIIVFLLMSSFVEHVVSILYFLLFKDKHALAYKIVSYGCNLLTSLIAAPLFYGRIVQYMKVARNTSPDIGDIFKPYDVYPKTIVTITFLKYLCMIIAFLPIFCYFIAAFIIGNLDLIILLICEIISLALLIKVALDFSMTPFYFMDHPDMPALQIIKESRALIKGKRIKYMLFLLSFIGYFLLGILTWFIGFIWILPYISTSRSCFYQALINDGKRRKPKPDWRPYISNADGFRS
ncbi:MAG: DUF975 family protein [Lachnospiraceae bacterium]|nr:DUF975 family protein [Lachnospiraceae bacterium]